MPFRALTSLRDAGRTFNAGDIVPGAGEWPTIAAEVRLGRVEPLRRLADGTLAPVRYRVHRAFAEFAHGAVLAEAHLLPSFSVLVRGRYLEPVLEDAVDQPTQPPAPEHPRHHQSSKQHGRR